MFDDKKVSGLEIQSSSITVDSSKPVMKQLGHQGKFVLLQNLCWCSYSYNQFSYKEFAKASPGWKNVLCLINVTMMVFHAKMMQPPQHQLLCHVASCITDQISWWLNFEGAGCDCSFFLTDIFLLVFLPILDVYPIDIQFSCQFHLNICSSLLTISQLNISPW